MTNGPQPKIAVGDDWLIHCNVCSARRRLLEQPAMYVMPSYLD